MVNNKGKRVVLMLEKLSNKLLSQIDLDKDEYEVIQYGLHQGMIIIVNLISILICAMLWEQLFFGILLFFVLLILRPYAGGYHADTELRCYMISVGIMNFAIIGHKYINILFSLKSLIYLILLMNIWKNAPVANFEKPLDDVEKERYSRKAKQIMVCYSLLAGLGMLMQNKILFEAVFWGMMVVALSVLAGKWKYRANFLTM